MKGCYVISKWIGTGTAEDPQRPLVADEYPCSCVDVTGQYVRLDKGSPDPNLAVFRVVELQEKHKNRVQDIKKDSRFLVLEEWDVLENGGIYIPVQAVSDKDVKTYLENKKAPAYVASSVKGMHRARMARELFKDFERR